MSSHCPYSKDVICEYASQKVIYECDDCKYYDPLKAHEPSLKGRSRLGCLIISIALIGGGAFILKLIINLIR